MSNIFTDPYRNMKKFCEEAIEHCGTPYIPLSVGLIQAAFNAHQAVPTIDSDDEQKECALMDARDEAFYHALHEHCVDTHDAIRQEPHFYDVASERMDAAIRINPRLMALNTLPEYLADHIATKPLLRDDTTGALTFQPDVVSIITNVNRLAIT
jgi:hypothetical protein